MNLNALRLFIAIVQDGSFSKTAERLNIPIATISRQIGELEKSLQIQLFDRQKTGVKPTMAGQQLYEHAHQSMDNLLQLAQNFGQNLGEIGGTLRISMVAGMDNLMAWLDEFCQQNPKVRLNIQTTDRLVDLVEDGIDFAFRVGEIRADNIVAKKLFINKTKWIAHPNLLAQFGTPQTWDDLETMPCVGYAKSNQKFLTIPNGKKPLEIPYIFASDNPYLIENAIKNGRGVGLLSEHIADRLINENGLIEILADLPKPEFAVHLLYVKHRHQTALIRAFLEFIDGKLRFQTA